MQWFDDVQIFLVIIFIILFFNCVLFLIIARKRGKESRIDELLGENGVDKKNRRRILFILKDFSDLVLCFGPILFATLRNDCDVFILNIQPCKFSDFFDSDHD